MDKSQNRKSQCPTNQNIKLDNIGEKAMSFFIDKADHYNSEVEDGLRKCQLGAIWATKSHFTISDEPALLSLPTGSGKTALMMALSFELKVKNIMIITPSQVIRHQTAEKFSKLDDLINIGVYDQYQSDRPKVEEQIGYINSVEKWNDLSNNYDVVVTTPNSSSPNMMDVATPTEKCFDVIFIDEAHHTGSSIYKAIIETFTSSRIILLTATPFRRDKKRIPGNLIYHYPVSKAIEDGIYRIVSYKPINTTVNDKINDQVLAEFAIKEFMNERKLNSDAKILIKTDSIANADRLKTEIYDKLDFNVEAIHSRKPDKQNIETIIKCKNGIINGIICVGMVGEGLDIPTLKMAVLHSSPQTLPATIQFIGRLSRVTDQIGNSILISDPNLIEGEVKELYQYDDGWEKLIPDLIDKKISQTTYIGQLGNKEIIDLTFSKSDISPFFSVTIHKVLEGFSINEDYQNKLPSEIEYYILDHEENEPIVIITKTQEALPWISKDKFDLKNFDLHIYYKREKFLFEHTTSSYYSSKIKNILFGDKSIVKASSNSIINGLRDTDGHYIMVGMANISGATYSNPKYKTYMGSDVENSLRLSDGRSFTAGHVLSKTGDNTRGIATKNSKIWSIERDYLDQFIEWCDHLYSLIHIENADFQIPRMGMLAKSEYIDIIPAEPAAIMFDDLQLQNSDVKIYTGRTDYIENPNIKVLIKSMVSKKLIHCCIDIDFDNILIDSQFDIDSDSHWKVSEANSLRIIIDTPDQKVKQYDTLEEFLNENPPLIILSDGRSIKENILFTPKIQNERFDQSLFNPFPIDWDDTDVFNEAKELSLDSSYKYNVQDKVLSIVSKNRAKSDFFILDDSSGEIADLIWFDNENMRISFLHCKYMHRNSRDSEDRTPGANKLNITELIDQGLRCGIWVNSPRLVSQIVHRINNTQKSQVLFERDVEFREIEAQFNPNDWSYRIVLIQPGLSKKAVFKKNIPSNVEKLLVTLFDRTKNADADLEVWANEVK